MAVAGAAWLLLPVWSGLGSGGGTGDAGPPACAGVSVQGAPDPGWGAIDVRAGTEVVLTTPSGRVGYAVTDAFARARGGGTWRVVVRTVKRNLDHPETYHGEWDYPALVVDGYPTSDGAACFAAVPEQVVPGERGRAAVGFDVSEDPTGGRVELAVEQDDVRGTLAVTR